VSVANPPIGGAPAGERPGAAPAPVDAACPLCGSPLDSDQEWCLRCGAAARTRLAAPSNWKAPLLALALVITLALGALAAALVKLIGEPGTRTAAPPITTTITSPQSAAPGVPGAGVPTTTTPATPTPTSTAGGLGAVPAPKTPGPVNPGTPTTLQPAGPAATGGVPPGSTGPGATTPANGSGRISPSTEEALRKAGFSPRSGR
jgi:hypothetical protein